MTLTVTIGGVAMDSAASHFVDEGSPSHVNALGQRDTFSCRIVSKDGSYTPAMGAAVEVTDDAGLRFGGSIREKTVSQFGVGVVTEIQCASWEQIFDRRYVGQQKSFVDTPAGDVFQYIFDNWLTFENLTASVVAAGPNISVSLDWCTVREAFDLIAQQASGATDTYMWDCTPAKVTRFYKQSSFAAPMNVSDASTDVMRPITINQSFGGSGVGYGNKAFIRVSSLITEDRTNTFGPDGVLDSFTFELPMASAPVITLDTGSGPVAQTVGIRDLDTGKDFYWQDGSPEITAAVAPAAGSTLVVIAKGYQTTVVDAGQNNDEVTARSIAEDNSGWYQVLIDSSASGTYADAVAIGQAWLSKYANGVPRAVEYVTITNGCRAGQHQTINLSGFGETINTTFILESVTMFQAGTEYGWRVRAVNGALANGWLQKLRAIAGSGSGSVAGGGTVISTGNSLALTPALSSGLVGVPYSGPLVATGGEPPYTFSISTGALPAWATLDAATGIISGTPTDVATTTFTARVTDTSSVTADADCSLIIADAGVSPNVAPDNVTIDSVTPDLGPTPIVNRRGISAGTQRGVELKYTAPDPIGTFLGVIGTVEAPDQSAAGYVPLDGSVNLGGGRRLGGPKDAAPIGPLAHADVNGVFRFSVPEPRTYPMTCRVRLMSYSGTATNDADTSPSATFVIAQPTVGKPSAGTAYCPNPTAVTIISTSTPKRREGVLMRKVRVSMTPPDDPRFAGVQWIVKDAAGEIINASGIQAETEFDLVFQELTAPQTCTVYACGSDGTNINPLVEGITPSATVDLGTIDGTVDLGQSMAASMGLGLGSDGTSLSVKIAGPLYEDVFGNVNLKISPHFTVAVDGTLTQDIVDLALATGFDTSAFSGGGGGSDLTIKATWITAQAIACNQLVAGNALFTGDASFARSGGGKVTINSAGVAIADNLTTPTATVTATSTGVTVAKGTNNVQVTASGVGINGPSGTLTATSSGIVISNGSSSVTVSASSVAIVNGSLSSPAISGGAMVGTSLTLTSGTKTISLNPADLFKITDSSNGFQLIANNVGVQASVSGWQTQVTPFGLSSSVGASSISVAPGGIAVNGLNGQNVTISYTKVGGAAGSLTFTGGILTSSS